jgi:hypothetical protein
MMFKKKLWLVGDDEVLDAIADLSRHLDYFQVARVDELPAGPYSDDDHLLVAFTDAQRAGDLVTRARSDGKPGYASTVPELPGKSTGARAIFAAAALVPLI